MAADPPRAPADPLIALINVILLLLVFVLMVARLDPDAPGALSPPASGAGTTAGAGGPVLTLDAGGVLRFGAASGDAALAAACDGGACAGGLMLRADAAAPASALAALLPRLSAAGAGPVRLATVPR